MKTSRDTWRLLVIAVLAANFVAALTATVSAQNRGRGHRHPDEGNRDRHESDWNAPSWPQQPPPYWESQDQTSSTSSSYDQYAAIAYSPSTGKYGYSYGYDNRCSAERAALRRCPTEDASIVAWTRNAWCVLALGDDVGEYSWAWATNVQSAKSRALKACRQRTTNCYIAVSVYSGN